MPSDLAVLTQPVPAGLPEEATFREAAASDRALQRAEGFGRIVVQGSEQGTRIADLFQKSPVRVILPRHCDGRIGDAILINTAGGITGGDCLEFEVTVHAEAALTITSQAAEKIYKALSDKARVNTTLKVHEHGKLAWLPQETIIFDKARLHRITEIDVATGAELLALEWLVLGRTAYGEQLTRGHISDSWRVRIDGRLIWSDTFRVTDESFAHLHRKALLSHFRAIATLVYFGPRLDDRLVFARTIASALKCPCTATLVGGLLIVRLTAAVFSDLNTALRHFLDRFSMELGGGPFRVPKMWSC